MKNTLFLLLLFSNFIVAQQEYLNFNGNRSRVGWETSFGFPFTNIDQADTVPNFEFPGWTGNNLIYSNSFWCAGKTNGQDSIKANTPHYLSNSYVSLFEADTIISQWYPGPIANDYNLNDYREKYYKKVWFVTKEEIEYHKSHYFEFGYEISENILNWPGNGDINNGESEILAPFKDFNNNGIYEPHLGEHPCIKGHEAAYAIMNDEMSSSFASCTYLKTELHLMIYQFWSESPIINHTTFIEAKIYNRSTSNYQNFVFGNFIDADIGSFNGDLMGTDTTRNLTYFVNKSVDEQYTNELAGLGVLELDGNLKSTMHKIYSYPNFPGDGGGCDYLHAKNLYGKWYNGSNMYFGGKGYIPEADSPYVQTNFMYSGYRNDGWILEDVAPNGIELRALISSQDAYDFNPESVQVYNYAYISNKNADTSDYWELVDDLFVSADVVQDFYDNMDQSCENSTAFVSNKTIEYNLYPNPANSYFQIELPGTFDYQLVNMEGKIIQQNKGNYEFAKINIEGIPSGIYFVEVAQDQSKSIQKIIIQ